MKLLKNRSAEPDDVTKAVPSWSLYSLAIILFSLFLQLLNWELFPFFIDIYYHLSVMLGFNTAGGYVLNSFWEYAPVGRPHLYPPLLHIVMLGLYKLGASKIFIARLLSFIIFPFTLSAIWLFVKKVFNDRTAFFAVLVASSVYTFYIALLTTIPATLALLCGLASFASIERGRRVAAAIFLTYAFYLHALMPWIIIVSFGLYCLLNKDKIGIYISAILPAIIAASPLILWQCLNARHLNVSSVAEDYSIEINVFLMLFALIGLAQCRRLKGRYCFPVCLAAGFLVLVPVHAYRYMSGEGVFAFVILAAIGLDRFFEDFWRNKNPFLYVISALVLFSLFSPVLVIDRAGVSSGVMNSTFANFLSISKKIEHGKARSIFFPKFYKDITDCIKENSKPDDIIFSNMDYFAGVLGVMSDRATSNSMLNEVTSGKGFDPIGAATIVIWLKDPGAVKEELSGIIERYSLRKIKETDISFIYKNDKQTAKSRVNRAIIPTIVLFTVFLASLGLAVFDL